MILRLTSSMLLGLGVSALLFWLMHVMLHSHDTRLGGDPVKQIDFVRLLHQDTAPQTIVRELPPPDLPDAPPPPPNAGDGVAPPTPAQAQAPAFDLPKLDLPIGAGTLAAPSSGVRFGLPQPESGAGGLPASPDAQLAAIVRIPPTYPIEARRKKIEGWVKMEFTIQEDGSVKDIQVKAAEPSDIFDQAAVAAIAQWKFRPAMENGKPVRRRARQTLKFELSQ